jgi:hypothetical protein
MTVPKVCPYGVQAKVNRSKQISTNSNPPKERLPAKFIIFNYLFHKKIISHLHKTHKTNHPLNGIQEIVGSIPSSSTIKNNSLRIDLEGRLNLCQTALFF